MTTSSMHPDEPARVFSGQVQANLSVLSDLLRQSCLELMADYGLPAELQLGTGSSLAPSGTAMAAIDFSGRDLRGTVALRVTKTVISETYRAACGSAPTPSSPEFADWTCELANQLVGRLKNKLRRYDVSFTVNTPRLIVALPVAELENAICTRFVCDRGTFTGYLDVLVAPGFAIEVHAQGTSLPAEGELVLF